jgi:hypothetical protein
MDLLTVVMHEMGHALGFEHDAGDDLMAATLSTGVRELPGAELQRNLATHADAAALAGDAPFSRLDATPLYVSADRSIDWSAPVLDMARARKADSVVTAQPAWHGDFVNHLARPASERNPNLGIRVQVEATSRVSSALNGRGS